MPNHTKFLSTISLHSRQKVQEKYPITERAQRRNYWQSDGTECIAAPFLFWGRAPFWRDAQKSVAG